MRFKHNKSKRVVKLPPGRKKAVRGRIRVEFTGLDGINKRIND